MEIQSSGTACCICWVSTSPLGVLLPSYQEACSRQCSVDTHAERCGHPTHIYLKLMPSFQHRCRCHRWSLLEGDTPATHSAAGLLSVADTPSLLSVAYSCLLWRVIHEESVCEKHLPSFPPQRAWGALVRSKHHVGKEAE